MGGRQMVIGYSDRKLNLVSVVTPVGNQALPSVGIARSIKKNKNTPIVYCSMGDGTTQQGEVLEALFEAKRQFLPVLFVIHDNKFAISTRTEGKTFFSIPGSDKKPNNFYNIPITYIDGLNPLKEFYRLNKIIENMRINGHPQIVVFKVERINSHSNADNHKLYRGKDELKISIKKDPITNSKNYLKH